jgi:hypothetical protein
VDNETWNVMPGRVLVMTMTVGGGSRVLAWRQSWPRSGRSVWGGDIQAETSHEVAAMWLSGEKLPMHMEPKVMLELLGGRSALEAWMWCAPPRRERGE